MFFLSECGEFTNWIWIVALFLILCLQVAGLPRLGAWLSRKLTTTVSVLSVLTLRDWTGPTSIVLVSMTLAKSLNLLILRQVCYPIRYGKSIDLWGTWDLLLSLYVWHYTRHYSSLTDVSLTQYVVVIIVKSAAIYTYVLCLYPHNQDSQTPVV